MPVEIRHAELDGKRVAYSSETLFTVEVGTVGRRYERKAAFVGNLGQAVLWYKGYNIGPGYQKRLVMAGARRDTVLARFVG
jgi:hypothetical protein